MLSFPAHHLHPPYPIKFKPNQNYTYFSVTISLEKSHKVSLVEQKVGVDQSLHFYSTLHVRRRTGRWDGNDDDVDDDNERSDQQT